MSEKHWRRHAHQVVRMLAGLPERTLGRLPPWLREGRCSPWDLQRAVATPPGSDQRVVRALYRRARALKMHVDHIEPLLGDPQVCGLHVGANLRVVSPHENFMKAWRTPHRDPQIGLLPWQEAVQLPLFGAKSCCCSSAGRAGLL